MKNICFSIEGISGCGGTERVTLQIANALVDKYNINILSIEKKREELFFPADNRIKFDYLYSKRIDNHLKRYFFSIIIGIRKYLKKNNIDILIVVDVTQLIMVYWATLGLDIKIISWEQFNCLRSEGSLIHRAARKIAAKYTNAIITLTDEDKKAYVDYFKPRANVMRIYNPITFPNVDVKKDELKENIILSIGRLSYQKGYDLLLDVANLLFNTYQVRNWKWIIVGEGDERKKIEDKISDYNLVNKVILVGEKENVSEYLNNSKIFVLTSRYEGFGLVIAEAQQFGLPVISFDCKMGPAELVENGKNGYLVPCFDIENMAKKIRELITDDNKRNKLAIQAGSALDRFEYQKIVDEWNKLINKL